MNKKLSMVYSQAKCYICGASSSDTVLNIEGQIHHASKIRCVDLKKCKRRQRKNKGNL